MNSIQENTGLNKDFTPQAYLKQITLWLSHFHINLWVIWIPLFILIPILIIRWNPIQVGMFTCGFSASAIELLLLITFQIVYGYVYHVAGILITLFMAGLAIGPIIQKRYVRSPNLGHFIILQSIIGMFPLLLMFSLTLIRSIHPASGFIHFLFLILMLIISILTGIFFAFASKLQKGKIPEIASGIYSSDLIGSAVGALLFAALLFPLLGLRNLLLLICCLNLFSALYTFIRRKTLANNLVS